MYKNVDEEFVLCPYNRSHVISKLRIQKHIIKCQKNYPDVKLATCFYNFTHRLKPEDMLKHYEICPQRIRVEGARYYDPGSFKPIDFLTKSDNNFNFPTTRVQTHEDFYNPCAVVPDSSETELQFERNTKFPESRSNHSQIMHRKSNPKTDFLSSDDEDDDKPLPLPRTVSKAFTSIKQNQQKRPINTSETPQTKGFGRARTIQNHSFLRQQSATDHMLLDLNDKDSSLFGKNKNFKVFSTANSNCNVSEVCSLFDDSITLKSQTIIFDDDYNDIDNDFNLKNVDKYKKIVSQADF